MMNGNIENSFKPSLIIGLGQTGYDVINKWIQHLDNTFLAASDEIAFVHINSGTKNREYEDPIIDVVKHFNLTISQNGLIESRVSTSPRKKYHQLFNQAIFYTPFSEYLQQRISKWAGDYRVYIIGSLSEPIIGMIGDLLYLLNNISIGNVVFRAKSYSVFLSFDSTAPQINVDGKDIVASLRELGRFTYKGSHLFPPRVTERFGKVFAHNLLTDIYLFDNSNSRRAGLGNIGFDFNICTVMAEAIKIFTSQEGQLIWEDIANVQTQTSNMINEIMEPVVSTISVSALYVPISLLREYIKARLARSVLMGERDQGFLNSNHDKKSNRELAIELLNSNEYNHPFFSWIMHVSSKENLLPIPYLDETQGFVIAYRKKYINFCNQFINAGGDIKKIIEVFNIINSQMRNIIEFGREQHFIQEDQEKLEIVVNTLKQMIEESSGLSEHLIEWWNYINGLYQEESKTDEHVSDYQKNPFDIFIKGPDEIRRTDLSSLLKSKNIKDENSCQIPTSIQSLLKEKASKIDELLKKENEAEFLYPVFRIDPNSPELDKFYLTITNDQNDLSLAENIKACLKWWLTFDEDENSYRLRIIGIPSNDNVTWDDIKRNPDQYTYAIGDGQKLVKFIIRECHKRTADLENEIGTEWFDNLVEKNKSLLSVVEEPNLEFDRNAVALINSDSPTSKLRYILGRDTVQLKKFQNAAFTYQTTGIKNISTGCKTKISAVSIQNFIPLSKIIEFQKHIPAYYLGGDVHVYPQEEQARIVERELKNIYWEDDLYKFPPEVVMTFGDINLVDLFFYALTNGIIKIERKAETSFSGYAHTWIVGDVSLSETERFAPEVLCKSEDVRDIWYAYKSFVIEKPYDPNTNLKLHSPFHPSNKQKYIEAIKHTCEINKNSEYKNWVTGELLPELINIAQDDYLIQGFVNIMRFQKHRKSW